jgi:hypothetical protein
MVGGLSQRPNLTEGPTATWDLRRSIEEEEEEDFLNIFAKKFSEKIGIFVSKQSQILKKVDHNIGF